MQIKSYLSLVVLATFLSGCHEDNEVTTTNNTSTLSLAANAYKGSTELAAQTESNAKRFPTAAFAARDYFLNGGNLAASVPGLDTYGKDTCSNGGDVTQQTTIEQTTKLGSKQIQFNNCQIADIIVDGPLHIDVTEYDAASSMPTKLTMTYEGLQQTRQGSSVTLTGTVEASQDYAARSVALVVDGHLKSSSGQELLADISVDIRGEIATRSAISTYSGKVCIDTEGCVEVSTETPFTMQFNGEVKSGELITTGANNGKVQVVANYGSYQHSLITNNEGN